MSGVRTFRSFAAGANLCSQLPHFRSKRKLSVVRALEGVGEIPAGKSLVTICGKGGGRSTEGAVMLEKLGQPDALWLEVGTTGRRASIPALFAVRELGSNRREGKRTSRT